MPSNHVDQEYDRFHALIGNAIGQWVHVEGYLFHILQEALAPSLPKLRNRVAAVFYANANFRVKLDMTDAALKTFLDKDSLQKWSALFRRLKKKSQKRTKLAHSHVTMIIGRDKDGKQTQTLALKPESNKPSELNSYITGEDDVTPADVMRYTSEFFQMGKDLEEFCKVVAQQARLPTYPAPTPDPNPSSTPDSQTGAARP